MSIIKQSPEALFKKELSAIAKWDKKPKPMGWKLSPTAVRLFILGGKEKDSPQIKPKFIGQKSAIELAITTLATNRGLLLMGVPGTGKTLLSELLATAISGKSTAVIQGTSGTHQDQLLYGWNYAQLIANGPSDAALVPGVILQSMSNGAICRIEELTRMPSDVMDSLITILSEKSLNIIELNKLIRAKRGFNLIATANDKDTGINQLSSALLRRFNIIKLSLPKNIKEEIEIVKSKIGELQADIPLNEIDSELITKLITIFKELREGKTIDGKQAIQSPNSVLSAAEIINIIEEGRTNAQFFNNGNLNATHVAKGVVSAIVRDKNYDEACLKGYLEQVMKKRSEFKDIYDAIKREGY